MFENPSSVIAAGILVLCVAFLFLGLVRYAIDCWREKKMRDSFLPRIYELTPNDKPFFVWNYGAGVTSVVTYDRYLSQDAERFKIINSSGDVMFYNQTASLVYNKSDDSRGNLDYLIESLTGCSRSLFENSNHEQLWRSAESRLFRKLDEMFVPVDGKLPASISQYDFDRMNTRCYVAFDLYKALEPDILESIESRVQRE